MWYQELDGANDRIRLRFTDGNGNTYGPYDVPYTSDGPRRGAESTTWIIEPDCRGRAADEAAAAAASGNTQVALTMLADIVADNVQDGQP